MSSTTKTPQPVMVTGSILAALHAFFAGSAATTVMIEASPTLTAIFAFGNLATAAAQIGVNHWVKGQVVPVDLVVERVGDGGSVVAGPANDRELENAYIRDLGGADVAVVEDVSRLDELNGVGRGEGGSAL